MVEIKGVLAQLARYLLVGGFAFLVDFGLFAFCLYVLGLHYLLANFIGLVAGLVLNYALSVRWVFSDCKRRLEMRKSAEFAVFAAIGFAGVALNELLMVFLVDSLHGQEMISKMIAAAVVLMWNFGVRKLTLFREKKD